MKLFLPRWLLPILLVALSASARGAEGMASEALWTALKGGGHIVMMRHALAPGTGDPPGFWLDDCATQRNLSAAGRDQASRTGQAFRERGVTIGQALSSQWRRCRETAERLNLGPVEPLPMLNSFFSQPENQAAQTEALKAFVSREFTGPSRIMVTHQVNITALTDVVPRSGGMVVLQPLGGGRFRVLGELSPE